MTRLGKEISAFREIWYTLPDDKRREYEDAIKAAGERLKLVTDDLPEVVGDAFIETVGTCVIEGATAVGSGVDKVKRAVAEGFPEIWEVVGPLLESLGVE